MSMSLLVSVAVLCMFGISVSIVICYWYTQSSKKTLFVVGVILGYLILYTLSAHILPHQYAVAFSLSLKLIGAMSLFGMFMKEIIGRQMVDSK